MQFGYSTLGDPDLSYEQALQLVSEFGLHFLEIRVLERSLDLPGYFANRKEPSPLVHKSVPVRALCSSLSVRTATPADVESCLAFAQLAVEMKTPYVRIFGGGAWGDTLTRESLETAASVVTHVRSTMKQRGAQVELLLETHDAFSGSAPCLALNQLLDPPLSILWDSHHTWKMAGETPEETWARLGPLVRHVHYKDSVSLAESPGQYRYVLPGAGEYPTAALFALLKEKGYARGVALEWEKLWHPDLAPLPEALAAFASVVAKHK